MIIRVLAGESLQAAIDRARAGDTIELETGATFVGNFITPYKDGATPPITLTGTATLRTPNSAPAFRTALGAFGWRFVGLTFAAGASAGDIVQLGTGTQQAGTEPTDIAFDRCTFVADTSAKRGLQMNSAYTTLRRCHFSGIKLPGQESQAIACWNGPGPFLIEDSVIEAGSIGVLFGGAVPSIPNLVPSDITFRRNVVTRPLAMRGAGFGVKNLFELKNAQRVHISGNVFEHNWPDGQSGWSIVFTVRANGPTAPWTTIRDVVFEHNVLRDCAMGFNILGLDNEIANGVVNPSTRMQNVSIRHNLLHDIDRVAWGGNGAAMLIGGAPENLHVERNTIAQTGNAISVNGEPCSGFRYVGNIVQHNDYGIFGDGVGYGNPAIARYFPGGVVDVNVIVGAPSRLYPPDNFFPTVEAFAGEFIDPAAGNYRIHPGSAFERLGADIDAIEAAQRVPVPPPEPTVAEIIAAVHEEVAAECANYDGSWSPRMSALDTASRMRAALLARVVP